MKKSLLILALCLFSFAGFTQVSNNTVMVRVVGEWYNAAIIKDSQILISYSDGEKEVIELEKNGGKNLMSDTEKIHAVLDRFFSDDYSLVSEQSNGGDNVYSHLWIFKKVD